MTWQYSRGCGGMRIYELVRDGFLLAVVQRDPDWWVWLPGERRPLISDVATLAKAKAVAERYFTERKPRGSKASRAAQRCRREGWRVKQRKDGMWDLRQGGAKLRLSEDGLLKFAFGDAAAA